MRLDLGGDRRRIGARRNGRRGVADAGFGIGLGKTELRSERFALRHQAVEVGALAGDHVARMRAAAKSGLSVPGMRNETKTSS